MTFKELCLSLRVTQHDLCKYIKVTRGQFLWKIQLINKGINRMSSEDLAKIKGYLYYKIEQRKSEHDTKKAMHDLKKSELDELKKHVEKLGVKLQIKNKEK